MDVAPWTGLDGMDGLRYRAPCGANNKFNIVEEHTDVRLEHRAPSALLVQR